MIKTSYHIIQTKFEKTKSEPTETWTKIRIQKKTDGNPKK